jgi:hypothetical protein
MTILRAVRYGLPLVMVVLGVALIVFVGGRDAEAAGITIIGSAALVALAGALVRFSIGETADRDREQAARDFFTEHGRWPEAGEPGAESVRAPRGGRAARRRR